MSLFGFDVFTDTRNAVCIMELLLAPEKGTQLTVHTQCWLPDSTAVTITDSFTANL